MLEVTIGPAGVDDRDVERVAVILLRGGVGILPTDTVYGLVARAGDRGAVERLVELKGRSPDKPFPVHVSTPEEANRLTVADKPPATRLMDAFWPGPLTLVMERRPGVDMEFQPRETLGIRMPDHLFCLEVIGRAGFLVVPSANPAGGPPPVEPGDIPAVITNSVDFFVDGGACPVGVASTVVDVTGGLRVLREGSISEKQILTVAGKGGPGV